jgi:hypothetical protein
MMYTVGGPQTPYRLPVTSPRNDTTSTSPCAAGTFVKPEPRALVGHPRT